MLCHIMLCYILLCYIVLYHIILYYILLNNIINIILYYVMLYYVMLYFIMLYYIILCYVILLYYIIFYYIILYYITYMYIIAHAHTHIYIYTSFYICLYYIILFYFLITCIYDIIIISNHLKLFAVPFEQWAQWRRAPDVLRHHRQRPAGHRQLHPQQQPEPAQVAPLRDLLILMSSWYPAFTINAQATEPILLILLNRWRDIPVKWIRADQPSVLGRYSSNCQQPSWAVPWQVKHKTLERRVWTAAGRFCGPWFGVLVVWDGSTADHQFLRWAVNLCQHSKCAKMCQGFCWPSMCLSESCNKSPDWRFSPRRSRPWQLDQQIFSIGQHQSCYEPVPGSFPDGVLCWPGTSSPTAEWGRKRILHCVF